MAETPPDDVVLVVLGAGASFDCMPRDIDPNQQVASVGVGGYPYRDARPPLVRQLVQSNRLYNGFVAKYARCRPVVDYLQRVLDTKNAPTDSFERALAHYQDTRGAPGAQQIMALRFYLRDLLWVVTDLMLSENLTGGTTNYTSLVRMLARPAMEARAHLCFVSFNYDLLLESACSDYFGFTPFHLDQYVSLSEMSIVKPHGSIQWEWRTGLQDRETATAADAAVIAEAAHLGNPSDLKVLGSSPHSRGYPSSRRTPSVPALAIPVAGKNEMVWPRAQEDLLNSLAGRVSRVLTVGWRGAEAHFLPRLEPLLKGETKLVIVAESAEACSETKTNLGAWAEKATVRNVETGFRGFTSSAASTWLFSST